MSRPIEPSVPIRKWIPSVGAGRFLWIGIYYAIEYLLHKEGYTIKGVQKLLKDGTINAVVENRQNGISEQETVTFHVDEDGQPVEPKPELDSVISELEEISALLKKAV